MTAKNYQILDDEDASLSTETDGDNSASKAPSFPPSLSSRATGLRWSALLQLQTFKLLHLNKVSAFGLDGLVRLGELKISPVDALEVALDFILASEAILMVFTIKNWAIKALRVDAVLGRGVAFQVAEAFGDELAISRTASIISRLAVTESLILMREKIL